MGIAMSGSQGGNPEGIQSSSPALARSDYAGLRIGKINNSERVVSIPNVSFIELDFISAQELAKLILKGDLQMVLLLACDVMANGFNL